MPWPRHFLAACLVASAVVASGCGNHGIKVSQSAGTDVHHGAILFNERCAGCHTLDAADAYASLDLLREIEGLRRALETRSVIGQAIGIVMTQETLTADAAFAELVHRSSRANMKLRDVAVAIVAEVERRATTS